MFKFNVQTPPIRTPLTELDLKGAVLSGDTPTAPDRNVAGGNNLPPRTSKEWYRFWYQSGLQINSNTNLVVEGTHANRLDPDTIAVTPDGALYCETDRGGVLYQLRNGKWWYVAGTMYSTLSLDARPTDLGVTDGGFEFSSTDTAAPYKNRSFTWSQTAWVETTLVRYGTHAARLAAAVAGLIDQMLWVETDRTNVLYQLQSGHWWFIAGTMYNTLSPDLRPTDLTTYDAGFDYRTTDSAAPYANRQFLWSGTAWVEVTPQSNTAQIASASAALTLTTTPQNIPGATLSLTKAGTYLIIGVFYFYFDLGDNNATLLGALTPAGGPVAALVVANTATPTVDISATVTQQWIYSTAGPVSVSLQAYKSLGTGTSRAQATHTTISALWVSP